MAATLSGHWVALGVSVPDSPRAVSIRAATENVAGQAGLVAVERYRTR